MAPWQNLCPEEQSTAGIEGAEENCHLCPLAPGFQAVPPINQTQKESREQGAQVMLSTEIGLPELGGRRWGKWQNQQRALA